MKICQFQSGWPVCFDLCFFHLQLALWRWFFTVESKQTSVRYILIFPFIDYAMRNKKKHPLEFLNGLLTESNELRINQMRYLCILISIEIYVMCVNSCLCTLNESNSRQAAVNFRHRNVPMPVIIVVHLIFLYVIYWFISQFILTLQLFSYYWNPIQTILLKSCQ